VNNKRDLARSGCKARVEPMEGVLIERWSSS